MATLVPIRGKRGVSYEVQFCDGPDRRPRVRLGKVPKKTADSVKLRIEHLIAAKFAGHSFDAETARWLDGIDDVLHQRLAAVGLVPSRAPTDESARACVTLAAVIDRYIQRREANLKPNTVRKMKQARRALVERFGDALPINSITAGDAADWREELLKGLSEASVATHIKCAKAFFAYARDSKFIDHNPFERVKAGSMKNSRRKVFVDRATIARVLAVCPDVEWRLVIVLARYGGLRIPSELQDLKWSDIKWADDRMVIHVPKKAHLDGHRTREVPLFPEIRPHLEEARRLAAPGSVYVVPRARQVGVNLRTHLERLLAKAGVAQWTRLFQNLRASRETELVRTTRVDLVISWLGHTRQVALDHYLMPTDEDFRQASQATVQNAVQSPAARTNQELAGCTDVPELAAIGYCTHVQLPPAGIEPATYGLGNHRSIH